VVVAVDHALAAAARAWIDGDPDPGARTELAGLLDTGDEAALRERFAVRLAFGTAGLRGPLRAGPNGMNVAVVRQTAAGLAAYLSSSRPGMPVVVVGYDARHGSERFALASAGVFAAAGLRALVLPRPLPTPVLAFTVRHLRADAGVMVTASHNPATDNGYKVYLGGDPDGGDPDSDAGGAQIAPPVDARIAEAIDTAAAGGPARDIPTSDGYQRLGDGIVTAYVAAAADTVAAGPRDVTVAYTPLHGVGAEVLTAAFHRAGFAAPTTVAAQLAPDPDFPTTPFPNPEEPGVMDRVLALGASIGADVVIANDPDADRCAVAVDGRVLTGDEVGVLLADHVLSRRAASGGQAGRVATTVVSAGWLRRLAHGRGAAFTETLTGFKWIMRAGPGLVYGYEEALGYAVAPDVVRDKDGITAALAVAELAAAEKARGRTLLDRLDDLARAYGLHLTGAVSVRVSDPRALGTLMGRLRAARPNAFGTEVVTGIRDLGAGRSGLPPSDVLVFTLAAGGKVVVRPSGTEPKLKAYLEVVTDVTDGALATARLDALRVAIREQFAGGSGDHFG
jgi:phosphomannomutase